MGRRAQAERANDHAAIAEAERLYEETRANIDEHFARIEAAEAEQRALMAGDRLERPIVVAELAPPPRPDLLSRRATKALRDRDELQARLGATRAEAFEAVQEIDRTREAEIANAAELARKGEPIPAESEVEKVERLRFRIINRAPTLRALGWSLRGHGRGFGYYVTVSVRMRICDDVGGTITAYRTERSHLGGRTRGRSSGSDYGRPRRAGCTVTRWTWRLEDKFFGIGYYTVRVWVRDEDRAKSRVITRSWYTSD